MKRTGVFVCLVLCFVLSAGVSRAADSIQGRIGVTGQIGMHVPSDSNAFEPFGPDYNFDTDVGFIGGGGLIFGITKNVALELIVTYTEFGAKIWGIQEGDFDTTNISMGAQYRFVDLPVASLVPYAGGGLDILLNGFSSSFGESLDVDTVVGGHVCGGVDFFVMKQLALNAEMKGVLAPDADMKYRGLKVGSYDPTSVSLTVGVRYFFN
jgi:outer membrane protein